MDSWLTSYLYSETEIQTTTYIYDSRSSVTVSWIILSLQRLSIKNPRQVGLLYYVYYVVLLTFLSNVQYIH
jgi:hypothetical protein